MQDCRSTRVWLASRCHFPFTHPRRSRTRSRFSSQHPPTTPLNGGRSWSPDVEETDAQGFLIPAAGVDDVIANISAADALSELASAHLPEAVLRFFDGRAEALSEHGGNVDY